MDNGTRVGPAISSPRMATAAAARPRRPPAHPSRVDRSGLPPLFKRHVRRPRLTDRLDASKARILMLTAPAGYGKTTLAAEWLQPFPANRVAWYRCTPASADVAALSAGIADAVSHILPAGDRLKQRLRVPQLPQDPARTYAELVAKDLREWPADAWLVVDDYHLVMPSEASERFVEHLLALAPLQVLITTRQRPTWATARRILYGEIEEVERRQLEMSSDEARPFLGETFTHQHGSPRSHWPLLVGLLGQSRTDPWDQSVLADALQRYIQEELFIKRNASDPLALLLLSVPPYITDEYATWVGPGAPAAIAALSDGGLLVPDEPRGRALHPLVRELLRNRLAATRTTEYKEALEASVGLLIGYEDWEAAISLATETDLRERSIELLRLCAKPLLNQGRLETLTTLLKHVAGDSVRATSTLLIRADLALRTGNLTEAKALARMALADDDDNVEAWLLYGRALHLSCDFSLAGDVFQRARALADTPGEVAQASWGRLIAAIEGEDAQASDRLAEFENAATESADDALRLASAKAITADHIGSYRDVSGNLSQALGLRGLATDPMAISNALVMSVAMYAAEADYRRARIQAAEAIGYCEDIGLTFARPYALVYRGMAEVGLREFSRCQRTLDELGRDYGLTEDPHLGCEVDLLRRRLALADPAYRRRSNWPPDLPDGMPGGLLIMAQALEALSEVAFGDFEVGLRRAEVIAETSRSPTAHVLALFTVGAGALLQAAEASPETNPAVLRAVARCRELHAFDAFVVAYRACPQLIEDVVKTRESVALMTGLLTSANDFSLARKYGLQIARRCSTSSLTAREDEVIKLLASGLGTSEIAAALFITPATVKVHVRNLRRKLGADNRLQAVITWLESAPRV